MKKITLFCMLIVATFAIKVKTINNFNYDI